MTETLHWDLADAQRRKLMRQAINDPFSIACMEAIGVAQGWHCLEIGAGLGSMAIWLSQATGPGGRVVATELPEAATEDLSAACSAAAVTVRSHDLEVDRLDDRFDLIHTRFVLEHIGSRDEVLGRLVRSIKTGGWIAVEDALFPDQLCEGSDLYRRALRAFRTAVEASGSDFGWAAGLHRKLRDLGMREVSSSARTDIYGGGSGQAEFWAANFANKWEAMAETGLVSHEELTVLIEELAEPDDWFTAPTVVVATGQVAEP